MRNREGRKGRRGGQKKSAVLLTRNSPASLWYKQFTETLDCFHFTALLIYPSFPFHMNLEQKCHFLMPLAEIMSSSLFKWPQGNTTYWESGCFLIEKQSESWRIWGTALGVGLVTAKDEENPKNHKNISGSSIRQRVLFLLCMCEWVWVIPLQTIKNLLAFSLCSLGQVVGPYFLCVAFNKEEYQALFESLGINVIMINKLKQYILLKNILKLCFFLRLYVSYFKTQFNNVRFFSKHLSVLRTV